MRLKVLAQKVEPEKKYTHRSVEREVFLLRDGQLQFPLIFR